MSFLQKRPIISRSLLIAATCSQSMIYSSLVLRSVEKRPRKLRYEIEMKWHYIEMKWHYVEMKWHYFEMKWHYIEMKWHYFESLCSTNPSLPFTELNKPLTDVTCTSETCHWCDTFVEHKGLLNTRIGQMSLMWHADQKQAKDLLQPMHIRFVLMCMSHQWYVSEVTCTFGWRCACHVRNMSLQMCMSRQKHVTDVTLIGHAHLEEEEIYNT